MNKNMKTFAIVIAALFIGGGSLALGALTAPQQQAQNQSQRREVSESPRPSQTPTTTPAPRVPENQAVNTLESAQTAVTTLLATAYPKATTDYTMSSTKLDDSKKWFTAILTYKGQDTMNRDTLRVLAQKKDGEWILRTTPPEIILSVKKYRDVPEAILKSINKPVSLPGTDTSPTINQPG